MSSNLPVPTAEESARSQALTEKMLARVRQAGGAVPFVDYMQWVLNEPGLGYYASNIGGFGPHGDFVTAPELTPLFGRCVAAPVIDVLREVGPRAIVLELGAGSGALADTILTKLQSERVEFGGYRILEPSAHLQAVQRASLQAHLDAGVSIEWLTSLDGLRVEGVIVGNEVIDALPVARFEVRDGNAVPLNVALDVRGGAEASNADFNFRLGPTSPDWSAWYDALVTRLGHSLPEEYRSERRVLDEGWLGALSDVLHQGALLFFDYGYEEREYFHPERTDGTLRCYFRHHAHADPFFLPGLQDVTASVDFSELARAADGYGLKVAGYTTQAWFLIATGLADMVEANPHPGPEFFAQASAVRTLMLPGEMGERIKVIGLTRRISGDLSGFGDRDLRDRL